MADLGARGQIERAARALLEGSSLEAILIGVLGRFSKGCLLFCGS